MEFLCLDLINSRWYATHKPGRDGLADAGWLEQFWQKWKLGAAPGAEAVPQLVQVRALLEALLERPGDCQDAVARLNQFLKRYPYTYALEAADRHYRLAVHGAADEFGRILAAELVAFLELWTSDEVGRIKRCQNPECGWAFYDESKNNTRRWCGGTCASLIKVRRFRSRQKDG